MCGELLFRRCNRHSVRTARVHTPARAWMAWPKASKESGMSQPLTLLLARKASQSWTGPKLGDSPIHSPQLSATLPHRQVPCHGSEQRLRSRAEQSRARVTRQCCDAAVREKKWRSGREKRSGGGSADAEAKADSADASHSADLSASSDLSRFRLGLAALRGFGSREGEVKRKRRKRLCRSACPSVLRPTPRGLEKGAAGPKGLRLTRGPSGEARS